MQICSKKYALALSTRLHNYKSIIVVNIVRIITGILIEHLLVLAQNDQRSNYTMAKG